MWELPQKAIQAAGCLCPLHSMASRLYNKRCCGDISAAVPSPLSLLFCCCCCGVSPCVRLCATAHVWNSEDNPGKWVLSSHRGIQLRLAGLWGRCLYLQSHSGSPLLQFLIHDWRSMTEAPISAVKKIR